MLRNGKAVATAMLASLMAMSASPSSAQPAAEAAIAARQSHYKDLAGNFAAINVELRKSAPDARVIASNAAAMKALAAELPTWFPKGSGPEVGVKTGAEPNIWTDPKGFAAAAKNLQDQTVRLAAISVGGDMNAIKAQAGVTGAACKACHEKYRTPGGH